MCEERKTKTMCERLTGGCEVVCKNTFEKGESKYKHPFKLQYTFYRQFF